MNVDKTRVLLTFQKNGQNGGPYHSHMRIMTSDLRMKYEFIPLIIPRFREMIRPKVFCGLIKQIKSSNATILHFTGLQLEGFCVLLIAKMAGNIKTLCAVRGSSCHTVGTNMVFNLVIGFLESLTLRYSDGCYSVSKFVSQWKLIKENAKCNFGYVYNYRDSFSISPEERENNRKEIRRSLGIDDDCVIVISTGRVFINKGFKKIEDIILNYEWKRIKFLIVGDGDYLDNMISNIRKGGKLDSVIFTGYRNDVNKLLDASDIFITCSYAETLGNSIIEASNHGLPCIGSNVGGIPEIIVDGETGYLVDLNNIDYIRRCITLLAKDKVRRETMGKSAQNYILRTFDSEKISKKLDYIYSFLTNSK